MDYYYKKLTQRPQWHRDTQRLINLSRRNFVSVERR